MVKSKKYLLIAGVVMLAVIIAGCFGIYYVRTRHPHEIVTQTTVTGDTSQTIEKPDIEEKSKADIYMTDEGEVRSSQPIDNTDASASLKTPEAMQQVIDKNKDDLNSKDVVDSLAQSYPKDLIPIYKAKSAADSNDIITDNGKPGWTARYGSDADPKEISAFYEELLKSTSNYKAETTGDTTNISGTIDNCNVSISVSANNPQRTGLDDNSSVSIFIEKV